MKATRYLDILLSLPLLFLLFCGEGKNTIPEKDKQNSDTLNPFSELQLEFFSSVKAKAKSTRASDGIYHEVTVPTFAPPLNKLSDFPTKEELNKLIRASERKVDTTTLPLFVEDIMKLYPHVVIVDYQYSASQMRLDAEYVIRDWYNKAELKNTKHTFAILFTENNTIDSIMTE